MLFRLWRAFTQVCSSLFSSIVKTKPTEDCWLHDGRGNTATSQAKATYWSCKVCLSGPRETSAPNLISLLDFEGTKGSISLQSWIMCDRRGSKGGNMKLCVCVSVRLLTRYHWSLNLGSLGSWKTSLFFLRFDTCCSDHSTWGRNIVYWNRLGDDALLMELLHELIMCRTWCPSQINMSQWTGVNTG